MIVEDKDRTPAPELVGGRLGLEFTNTVHDYNSEELGDKLTSYSELVTWARQAEILSDQEAEQLIGKASLHAEEAGAVLTRAKSLRTTIYNIFSAIAHDRMPADHDVAKLNASLTKVLPHLQLVKQPNSFDWVWREHTDELEALLWPVIRSAAELLASDEALRTSECNGHDCTWLFIDRSKNHSRRWCDMDTCGNRVKARRHYARKRGREE